MAALNPNDAQPSSTTGAGAGVGVVAAGRRSSTNGVAPAGIETALVPVSELGRSDKSLFNNADAQSAVMAWQPPEVADKKHSIKVEGGIFQSGLSLLSKKEFAKQ